MMIIIIIIIIIFVYSNKPVDIPQPGTVYSYAVWEKKLNV